MTDFWTPRFIAQLLQGEWLCEPDDFDCALAGVSIDTRTLTSGQVYVAIPGERYDGHRFVHQAFNNGASLAIVSGKIDDPPPGTLQVEGTTAALQQLARAWRGELAAHDCKVIAITGSNGKTTTRHLIHHVLSSRLTGTQSPKSFNNHLGVPLTLLAAKREHDFVVAEVGTNHPGEIAHLADILTPDCAVITTIGLAHIGNFGSAEAIEKEKRSIYEFVRPTGLKVEPDLSPQENIIAQLDFPGEHMKRNAQAAVVVARWMDLGDATITSAMKDVPPVEGRLQELVFDGITVIHDAYNANPDSVRAAIDVLMSRDAARRVLIFGDMFELGDYSDEAHHAVGEWFRQQARENDLLITVGPQAHRAGGAFGFERWTDEVPDEIAKLLRAGDVVLLKASRGMRLERVLDGLR